MSKPEVYWQQTNDDGDLRGTVYTERGTLTLWVVLRNLGLDDGADEDSPPFEPWWAAMIECDNDLLRDEDEFETREEAQQWAMEHWIEAAAEDGSR